MDEERSFFEQEQPSVWREWRGFVDEVFKDGALSVKTKELIAIGLAISVKSKPCLKIHLKKGMDAGVTREEIAEVLSVAVDICGCPCWADEALKELL
jgi:AhpD family alkylhydroperoxidase